MSGETSSSAGRPEHRRRWRIKQQSYIGRDRPPGVVVARCAGFQLLAWVADPGRSASVILALFVPRGLATSATVAGGGVGGLVIPLVVAETTGRPSFAVPGLIAAVAAELLMGQASVTEQLDHTTPDD